MFFKRVFLKNFRNYSSLDLVPGEGINVFFGKNAQGKTNLLEALYLILSGRSHRVAKEDEMIRWGSGSSYIKALVSGKDTDTVIEFGLSPESGKVIRVDGKNVKRISDLTDIASCVMFSPDDLELVKGSPSVRRRFLDELISQLRPKYRYNLSRYNRLVLQKNNLLREIKERSGKAADTLELWNQQLASLGAEILSTRFEVTAELSVHTKEISARISGGDEAVELLYLSSMECTPEEGVDVDGLKERLLKEYSKRRNEEVYRGITIVGPHRDDFSFMAGGTGGIDLKVYGSQGQQRSGVLSLKMAQLEYVKEKRGEYPVLLLDDVLSELDESRRDYLLRTVTERIQSFITSTDFDVLGRRAPDGTSFFEVSGGNVKRCESL